MTMLALLTMLSFAAGAQSSPSFNLSATLTSHM